jgi:hypothetical protein
LNPRKLIPKTLKQPVKQFLLRRKLDPVIEKLASLKKDEVPSRNLLSELLTEWSNDAYVANLDYLEEVAKTSIASDGPILECGSGATTILLAALAARRGVEVWSLEHSSEWHQRVVGVLRGEGLGSMNVALVPLISYGDFDWYAPPLARMPSNFSLVICDGPPGTTKGGRHGLIPIMGDRMSSHCIVLLDDAGRDGEQQLMSRWEIEAGFDARFVESMNNGFAILQRRIK